MERQRELVEQGALRRARVIVRDEEDARRVSARDRLHREALEVVHVVQTVQQLGQELTAQRRHTVGRGGVMLVLAAVVGGSIVAAAACLWMEMTI